MIKKIEHFKFNKKEKSNHVKYHLSKISNFLKNFKLTTFFIFVLLLIVINADFTNVDLNKKFATNSQRQLTTKIGYANIIQNNSNKKTIYDVFEEKLKGVNKMMRKREIKNIENWDINEENTLSGNSYNKRRIRQVQLKENKFIIETAATKPETLTSAVMCQEYNENCTMICSNGSVTSITNGPKLKNKCPNNDLNLMVEKCGFNNGILQQSFFSMNFSLGFLSINECNLTTIRAGAFKHENVKNLHTLILTNNHLISLQANTFEGLANLLHFELVQNRLCCIFEGKGFFKPMEKKLKKAILQPRKNSSEIIDPLYWWHDLQLYSLIDLDISNTNLKDILKSSTFQPFATLESLRLMNCNLMSLKAETFDFISSSFKYLDLRFNHLQTLDNKVLLLLTRAFVKIELSFNNWNCECNTERMQYFTEQEVQIGGEILCSSPEKYQQTEMMQVLQACMENKNTTITIPSINARQIPNVETSKTALRIAKDTNTITPETTNQILTDKTTTTKAPMSDCPTTTDIPLVTRGTNVTPIKCFSDETKTKIVWRNIAKSYANFSLYITSSTTLTIKLPDYKKFSILYFPNHQKNDHITYLDCSRMTNQSESETVVFIKDLKPSTVYQICVGKETDFFRSSDNCQGVFMEMNKLNIVWLLQTDKVWFMTINTIAAVLLFVITLFAVYGLLRRNSEWLKISKFGKNSRKISLSSKSRLSPSPSSERHSDYLYANEIKNENIIYTSHHTIPKSKAPILPPLTSFNRKTSNCASAVEKDYSNYVDYLDLVNYDPNNKTSKNYDALQY